MKDLTNDFQSQTFIFAGMLQNLIFEVKKLRLFILSWRFFAIVKFPFHSSKLYGVNATIIIFVFVLSCIVFIISFSNHTFAMAAPVVMCQLQATTIQHLQHNRQIRHDKLMELLLLQATLVLLSSLGCTTTKISLFSP